MASSEEKLGLEVGPLNNDMFLEVLKRVDPVTLATVSCASSGIRKVSDNEGLWEKCCNERWPSTKDPEVKALVREIGGFRKLYANCYPLIISREQPVVRDVDNYGTDNNDERWDDQDMGGEEPDFSPRNLVSIVDVVYSGKCIFSKTVHGIPGADDFLGWFSNCPFRIDLLRSPEEEDERVQGAQSPVFITDGLPSIVSVERERKDGKFWKAFWDNVSVSWIMINTKTKEMANLSSWRPLGGLRHWPCDADFLIRFGSILPAYRSCLCNAVQCNIVMKCRLSGIGETVNSKLRLTELSMQLEDIGGAHVNGKESLAILHTALSCPRSRLHSEVLSSYHQYLKVQSDMKERKIRREGRLDTAAVVSGIGVFMFICYFVI